MKGQLLAALGLVISAGSLVPAFAGPTPPQTNVFSPGVVAIALSCSVDKTAQKLTVTHINSDRLNSKIPTSFRIAWSGTNSEGVKKGVSNLTSDLAPFKSVAIPVNAQFDSCKATAFK